MKIVVIAFLLMVMCSCHSNTAPFKLTKFKQPPDCGFDRGTCSFVERESEADVFITYDTVGYLSINDSLIVLRDLGQYYESDQFRVDVKIDGWGGNYDTANYYDCIGVVTITKKNVGSITKKVFGSCGL